MLKRIVFIWEKEDIIKDMTAILRELEEKHTEALVRSADDEVSEEKETEDTLFVTDSAR